MSKTTKHEADVIKSILLTWVDENGLDPLPSALLFLGLQVERYVDLVTENSKTAMKLTSTLQERLDSGEFDD
jgi:hypothetical protein